MKKLLKKIRELDDLDLAMLQESVHGEIARRHPKRGIIGKSPQLRVVRADDKGDERKSPPPRRRKSWA